MTRIRVLHVMGTGRPGGVETFVWNAVRAMDTTHYDFAVCVVGEDGSIGREIRALDVPVVALGVKARFGLVAMVRLARLIAAGRFDIVHLHVGGRLLQFLVRHLSTAVVVAHLHGPLVEPNERVHPTRGHALRVSRVLGSRPVRMLTCQDVIGASLLQDAPEMRGKVAVVPYGVDMARFVAAPRDSAIALRARDGLGVDPGDFVLMFVGRLVPQKGIPQLVDIIERVSAVVATLKVVVIGDGPLRSELEPLRARLGESRIILFGERSDVHRWLPACDVLAVTSQWEAFGIVSIEAMACARPVVAFSVDGVPAVIGDAGVLVDPNDTKAFASAVAMLAADPAARDRLGELGRARVAQHFTVDHVARRLEEEYMLALAARKSVRS